MFDGLDAATCAALGFRRDGIADLSRLGLSKEAVEARQNFIGGSDATVIGHGVRKEVARLCDVKRGARAPEDLSGQINVALGNWTEPFILAWVEKKLGVSITRCRERVHHLRYPHLACTLDGWVADWNGLPVTVQVKHVAGFSQATKVIDLYRFQNQHEIAVTGAEGALLVVLFGTFDLRIWEIEPDYDLWAELLEAEQSFWSARLNGWAPKAAPITRRPSAPPRAVPLKRAA